jgi:YggT family protein
LDPITLVDYIFYFFYGAILARIILSFLVPMSGPRPNSVLASVYAVANQITEPILGPIRRIMPSFGGLDFSPMVAILLLAFIRWIIVDKLL